MTLTIDKLLTGHMTGIDLTESTGTIEFATNVATILSKKTLFEISYENFSFSLKFNSGEIIQERCGHQLSHKIRTSSTSETVKMRIVFEPDSLGLLVGDRELFDKLATLKDNEKENFLLSQYRLVKYEPVLPPNSMLPWLRKQALLPNIEFNSFEELLDAIAVMLVSIESKIKASNMFTAFWNSLAKKDPEASPKKEVDIHTTILGLIQDECLAKGLEISHEGTAAGGSLDFYISGYIKNIGIKGLCVEVKHAHSSKLDDGLRQQLPAYMKSKGSDFGFYLVLWSKGDQFDKPVKYDNLHLMEDHLHSIRNSTGLGMNIRILTLNLAGQSTPSSM